MQDILDRGLGSEDRKTLRKLASVGAPLCTFSPGLGSGDLNCLAANCVIPAWLLRCPRCRSRSSAGPALPHVVVARIHEVRNLSTLLRPATQVADSVAWQGCEFVLTSTACMRRAFLSKT